MLRIATSQLASTLGSVQILIGRVTDGTPLFEEADSEAVGLEAYRALIWTRRGRALRLAGRVEESRALVMRALALARERGERGHEAEALCLLGELAIGTGSAAVENAEAYLRAALALTAELAMRPLEARCLLALGMLHRTSGRAEDARAEILRALERFRDMAMPRWLEQAEATLAVLA